MRYRGFERCLCRNGHLHTDDGYMSCFDPRWRCPICDEPQMWWEGVDQTNDAGIQTALLEHRAAELCFCQDCGHQHQTKPPQYCCPENRRARAPQPLVPVGQRGYEVLETGEVFSTMDEAAKRHEELWRLSEQRHRDSLRCCGLEVPDHYPDQDAHGRPRTAWAVQCNEYGEGGCGLVYLTEQEYDQQRQTYGAKWRCPVCGAAAWWDDENLDLWENKVLTPEIQGGTK